MTSIEAVMESPTFKRVMPIAVSLHPDEKAYWLWEVVVMARGNRGWRRAQIIYVDRGDRMARWARDMGPAEDFTAQELSIPSMWVHSVAQLQDEAEKARLGDTYWQRFLSEQVESSTLIPDAIAQYHERRAQIRNRSTVGPYFTRQRNAFPTAMVARKAKEIRAHGKV